MNHKSREFTKLSNAKSRFIGDQSQNLPFSFLPRLYFLTFCYRCSTFVENPLQIHLFLCKTKPISWLLKMNATSVTTSDYEEIRPAGHPKNKPNSNPIQSQTNPIGPDAQNERNFCLHNRLQRKPAFQTPQKQTQFKAKQTQFAGMFK